MLSNTAEWLSQYSQSFWRNTAWATGMSPYAGIPHLRGNPITGRLPYLQQDGILNTVTQAGKLAEESNSGMCSFWVENKLILLITKPEYVYDYKTRFHKYVEPISYWNTFPGSSALFSPENGIKLRKAFHHTLADTHSLLEIQPRVTELSDKYINALKIQNEPSIADAGIYFRQFALELGARLFMGIEQFESLDHAGILGYLSTLLAGASPDSGLYLLGFREMPSKWFFNHKYFQQLNQFKQSMQNKLEELFLNKHQTEILGSDNLLHSLWKLGSQTHHDKELKLTNLFPDAFFFLTGGLIITTGDSFPLILKAVCDHPEVEFKLREELNSLQDKEFNAEKISQLVYLDMIIKEVYRVTPPVPLIPARVATKSFVFRNIKINQGDTILIAPHVNHHSVASWKDPENFNPERFAKDNKEIIEPGAYIPFGLGERDCIGRRYGLTVIKTLVAKLFKEFDIKLTHNSDSQLIGQTILTNQMQIKLTPRVNIDEENKFYKRNW